MQERLVEKWANDSGCRLIVLRPSSIFGVGCPEQTFLATVVRAAMANQPIELYAPREYRQNFVAVADVGKVVLEALSGTVQGTFNLFSNDTLTASELADRAIKISGSRSEVVDRSSSARISGVHFDNHRFGGEFTTQFTPFEETLRQMCDAMSNGTASTVRSA